MFDNLTDKGLTVYEAWLSIFGKEAAEAARRAVMEEHPSSHVPEGSSLSPISGDSEDVYTGIISPEQAATNTRNWTEIKQKLHGAALAKMTPEEQRQFNIDKQAKADRRQRGY